LSRIVPTPVPSAIVAFCRIRDHREVLVEFIEEIIGDRH